MHVKALTTFLAATAALALAPGCATTAQDDDVETSSAELACRDLSGNYRFAGECGLGLGSAAAGAPVTVRQTSCTSLVTLETTTSYQPWWNPMPPRYVGPYDRCALAKFDAGSHGGKAQLKPEWRCDEPLPPLPPKVVEQVSVPVERNQIKEGAGSAIYYKQCALLWVSPTPKPPPPPPPPMVGPTGKLARGTFLRTAELGYDEFLAGGTVVSLVARPSSVAARAGFTWVALVDGRSGFIADFDLAKP